jgi:hypothetical protein
MVLTVSAVYLFWPFNQKFNLVTKRFSLAGKNFYHSVFSLCVLSHIERVPDQTWSSSASNMHPLTNLHWTFCPVWWLSCASVPPSFSSRTFHSCLNMCHNHLGPWSKYIFLLYRYLVVRVLYRSKNDIPLLWKWYFSPSCYM